MNLKIRRADFSDKPEIFNFLMEAYGANGKYNHQRWDWQFRHNPFRASSPALWLAFDGPEIVGQYGGLTVRLACGGAVTNAIWGVDFYILKQYRGRGIGQALMEAVLGEVDCLLSMWLSSASEHLNRKLGAQLVSTVTSFSLTKQAASTVIRTRHGGVSIEPLARFDPGIDDWCRQLAQHFHGLVERSAAYLNWKYFDQPGTEYEALVAKAGTELKGFIVFRRGKPPEKNVGMIGEVVVFPGDLDVARTMIQQAEQRLFSQGVDSIVLATSWPSLGERLMTSGYQRANSIPLLVRPKHNRETIQATGRLWLVGKGDSDWDQHPAGLA